MEGERVPTVIDRAKVFRLDHGSDGVDVASQRAPGKAQPQAEVLAGGGVIAAVQGVIKKGRRHLAAGNAGQLPGPLELPKRKRLEEALGGGVKGQHAAHRKAVRQAHPSKRSPQRIAGKRRKAGGILLEVLEEPAESG